MLKSASDRRLHRRTRVARPCKICDPRTHKFISGTTIDLSEQSVLLSIPRPVALKPGDLVLVGVAMKERQGLIQAKEMIESEVVRTMLAEDNRTTLAVRFTRRRTETVEDGLRPAA